MLVWNIDGYMLLIRIDKWIIIFLVYIYIYKYFWILKFKVFYVLLDNWYSILYINIYLLRNRDIFKF